MHGYQGEMGILLRISSIIVGFGCSSSRVYRAPLGAIGPPNPHYKALRAIGGHLRCPIDYGA